MREGIGLYRGKWNGSWVTGAFCPKNCDDPFGPMVDKPSIIKLDEPNDGYWFDVDPDTVGQYIGVPDKRGQKIFEGDILEGEDFTPEDGGYGVVSFENGAFVVSGNNLVGTFYDNYYGAEFEVIGNIYDNPELLEVEGDD